MSAGPPAAGGAAGSETQTDRHARPALIALALLAVLAAALILVEGRGITFFFDEWDFLLGRRGHSAEDLLAGQNGNPSFFPVVLFKGLLQLFGTDDHWAFGVALLVLHLLVVGAVLLVVARRVGWAGGAVAAALVLVLGRASDDLLWAFQTGFVLSVLGGVVAFAALDAERPDPRASVLACAALVLAVFSSSTGIPFLLVAIVEVSLSRERARRAWVVAIPLVLYVSWSLGYGDSQFRWENVPLTPAFAADLAANSVGGAVGLSVDWGRPLALAALASLLAWWLRDGRPSPRLWGLLAGLIALWGVTGLARASTEEPTVARYVYAGAVLVILAAAEVLRGRRLVDGRAALAALALVVFAGVAGWGALHARGTDLRDRSDDVRARLAALDLAGGAATPDFAPVPVQPQVTAGAVLAVQRDFGRIAWTPAELRAASQPYRTAADQTLIQLGEVGVAPAAARRCGGAPLPQATAAPGAEITVTAGGPTDVRAARFGDVGGATPVTTLPPGTSRITLRPDTAAGVVWRLVFSAPVRRCA